MTVCRDRRGHDWMLALPRMGVMRWVCARCDEERFEED